MGWFRLFSPTQPGGSGDAADMISVFGTSRFRRDGGDGATLVIPQAPEPPLTEEIKRRQVAISLRYVTAIRTR